MELIFASHNENKVREIAELIGNKYFVNSLSTIGFNTEIEENGSTFTENALIKARTIYQATNKNCFADDTGLLVEALNNEPGVYSARYAGLQKNADNNMDLLLKKMAPFENKTANFTTVIALILNGKEFLFEGVLFGKIIPLKIGTNGFGYDPVFIPNGYDITLAQMDLKEKNKISHRAIAFQKMVNFLNEYK